MDGPFSAKRKVSTEAGQLHLHCVPTDNREALLALGFQPMYPRATKGDESRLWSRSIESGCGSSLSNGRRLVMQRAYLEEKKSRR
jgi:hypothetical protein